MENIKLKKKAIDIRKSILTQVYYSQSGHPGGSLSAVEILTYLYFEEMNIDPAFPKMIERDRFVMSKGHATPGYYAALAHRGYFPISELRTFRKLGSHLQGHPCMQGCVGVDMSTGSLGQGFAVAAGMALSFKMQNMSNRVYVLCGDGELQEGQIWETAMFSGHKKLDNLTVIVDNNDLQIDGDVRTVCNPHPIDAKFRDFNFHTVVIDGHDFNEIKRAFIEAKQIRNKPVAIIAKTVKGKGVDFMENQASWHGKAPNDYEFSRAMEALERGEIDGVY